MKKAMASQMMRYVGCAVLLAVLAISSYAAGEPTRFPVVPVMIETVSSQVLTASSMERISEMLDQKRQEALLLLQSVIDDPQADEASRKQAQAEKVRIAACMEKEASLCALLEHMGFERTAVVAGEDALSIVVPWQMAENEHNRVRIIDAAAGHSGFSAEAIKIILAKK